MPRAAPAAGAMAVSSASAWLSSWGAPDKRETDWSNELAEAQHLLRDVAIDLQDREAKFRRGADAARLTAGIRRRVSSRVGCLALPFGPAAGERPPRLPPRRSAHTCAWLPRAGTRRRRVSCRGARLQPSRKSTRCELVSC